MPQSDRSTDDIRRDIEAERERLTAAFAELGNAVDDAVADLQRTVAEAGQKALVVAPVVAAVVAGLLLVRRGRRKRKRERRAE